MGRGICVRVPFSPTLSNNEMLLNVPDGDLQGTIDVGKSKSTFFYQELLEKCKSDADFLVEPYGDPFATEKFALLTSGDNSQSSDSEVMLTIMMVKQHFQGAF